MMVVSRARREQTCNGLIDLRRETNARRDCDMMKRTNALINAE